MIGPRKLRKCIWRWVPLLLVHFYRSLCAHYSHTWPLQSTCDQVLSAPNLVVLHTHHHQPCHPSYPLVPIFHSPNLPHPPLVPLFISHKLLLIISHVHAVCMHGHFGAHMASFCFFPTLASSILGSLHTLWWEFKFCNSQIVCYLTNPSRAHTHVGSTCMAILLGIIACLIPGWLNDVAPLQICTSRNSSISSSFPKPPIKVLHHQTQNSSPYPPPSAYPSLVSQSLYHLSHIYLISFHFPVRMQF